MVFPILTEMMDLCCGLQEAPESMAVRVVEASWSSGTVRSSLHILKSKRNMKTGLKSLWFTMVHCCRRKFVGLCRIKNSVWTGNEGGSEGPNTTKQGIDWIVYFYVLMLDACWDCNDQRLSMFVFFQDTQPAMVTEYPIKAHSLSLKKHKLWTPCFSFAERIAWQVVD